LDARRLAIRIGRAKRDVRRQRGGEGPAPFAVQILIHLEQISSGTVAVSASGAKPMSGRAARATVSGTMHVPLPAATMTSAVCSSRTSTTEAGITPCARKMPST
jgi:hypothetical protein